jgi:hypothetical protein
MTLYVRFLWYDIVCKSFSDVTIKIWSSVYSILFTNFMLFSCIPFIHILNSCIILLMYILNNTGERPHHCLAPLFMCIVSDIQSLNLILSKDLQLKFELVLYVMLKDILVDELYIFYQTCIVSKTGIITLAHI